MAIQRIYRRIRFGEPVVIVSGLPRSGTSMMMQMLESGGMPIVSDFLRQADESNPQGYYELESVKELDKSGDTSWLRAARGHVVKIIAYLLRHLPQDFNYKVVLMQRDLAEVLASHSQSKMLASRGESSDTADERMRRLYVGHLAQSRRLLSDRPCFESIEIHYREALADPEETARKIERFLGKDLNTRAMAAAVNPDLYRNRAPPTP
jgi:hypothetical protein